MGFARHRECPVTMAFMEMKTLTTELDSGILLLTLNRPDRLNAFTQTMAEELLATLDEIDSKDHLTFDYLAFTYNV